MKAEAGRCSISLTVEDYKDVLEGLAAIDATTKVDAELRRLEDLRERMHSGRNAAQARRSAANVEKDLT